MKKVDIEASLMVWLVLLLKDRISVKESIDKVIILTPMSIELKPKRVILVSLLTR